MTKLFLNFYLAPNQISCKIFGNFWPTEPVDFSRTESGGKQQGEPHSPPAAATDAKAKLGQTSSQQQLQMCFLQHGYSTDDYSDLEADSEDDDNSSDVDIVGDTKLYQLT